ncbi:iron-containing alcohol dehydrogenase [Helcococcus kunzii]|uniref:iron-containing alcohol dehydrogenase n=1 Tax=Helcococcus kunzii TaxID=40091 RepID=UPI0024AD9C95|nr:iron-containing alcohol dehydrogenase [Helcococcus kunzii]
MLNFKYYNPSKIFFGQTIFDDIKNVLELRKVRKMLLIYGGEYVKKLGIYDNIVNICKDLSIDMIESDKVVPNPKVELTRDLINISREEKVDFIIAVGGGSAIDTAKAVSIGIKYEGDVWDFFEGKAKIVEVIPVGVISTIPASGSETSNATIINNGLYKKGFEDDRIIPIFAAMNPVYTLSLPFYQTSVGIADILSHLLERYFTNVKNVDVTDYLIEGAIKALLLNAYKIIKDPNNINVRSEIQWLATIAHNNLLDTGRESDWASHRIEHEISAQYDVTHGEGMAIVILGYIRYMSGKNPKKIAQLSNRLFDIDYNSFTESEMCIVLAEKFEDIFKLLGLKTKLSELDIDTIHFEDMANRATQNNTIKIGHYYPLDNKKIIDVLKLCL